MVKSAYRVTQILEAVASSRTGLRHVEIAEALKIPKGSLSLLLADLVTQDYLSLKEDGKRYVLGPQVLVIAKHYLAGLDLVQIARPIIKELVIKTGESVEIAIRRGHEILIVCREDCSRPLRSFIQIGDRGPLYATAAGKAILAHLPAGEIDHYFSTTEFRPITRKTTTSPRVLRNELEAIRSGAVAYCREELNEGVVAMAVPVFDFGGQVAGSIVVPIPTIRFNGKKEKTIEQLLREVSSEVSHQLGFDSRSNAGRASNNKQRRRKSETGSL